MGCGASTESSTTTPALLQGFFTDKNHYKEGTWEGVRFISNAQGVTPGNDITLIGSDDGSSFWKLDGKFTDKAAGKVAIDFSPKGGPAGLDVTWADGKLTFDGGNHWARVTSPGFAMKAAGGAGALQGVFTDKNHYKEGTWQGVRCISDAQGVTPGNDITLIGSDDGESFWKLDGKFTDKAAGKAAIDFSPKGGPAGLDVTWADGKLTFGDGNHWARVDVAA